jgi:hypothetical protein
MHAQFYVYRELLMDPTVQILGFGWDGSDEQKMQSTFKLGRDRCVGTHTGG